MTTIRRTRVPAHLGMDTHSAAPTTVGTMPSRAEGSDPVRLALIDPPGKRATLDGAWWPWTRSLERDLPGLVEELHRRGVRVTRVAYNPEVWDSAPRRLAADGRIIRLGWFRSVDPHLLNLSGDTRRSRVDLLVIPPATTAAAARQAFTTASDPANHSTATALLAALHAALAPVPPSQPGADGGAVGTAAPAGTLAATALDIKSGPPPG